MGDVALAVRQVRYTNRSFWRNPASAFFTFAFPLMFLVIFTALFGNDTIRVTTNNAAMQFDVSGDDGNDYIELHGVWNRVHVFGGLGSDTLKNRGTGQVDLNGIEVLQ